MNWLFPGTPIILIIDSLLVYLEIVNGWCIPKSNGSSFSENENGLNDVSSLLPTETETPPIFIKIGTDLCKSLFFPHLPGEGC